MRPTTLITTVCALSVSVVARNLAPSSSFDLSAATASAAALYSSMETANPTALLSEINSQGTAALATLKSIAATASGAYGSSLRQEASQLAQQLSSAENRASAALGKTTRSGSSNAAATDSSSGSAAATDSSSGFAAATAVPIAALGVGVAVLGML